MAIHRVGFLGGPNQSNGQGSDPTGGGDMSAGSLGSNAAVRFVASDNFGESTAVGPCALVGWGAAHHGPEQKIAARAVAAGWTSGGNTFTLLKISHNGTPVAHFAPKNVAGNGGTDGVDWYRHRRVIAIGMPSVTDFRWYFYGMQGESDCDTADGSLAQANALGANQLAVYNAVVALMGKASVSGCVLGRINVNAWGVNQAVTAPWVPQGIASQVAIQAANPSLITLINNDSRTLYTEDSLHYKSISQHAQGDDVMDIWLARDH